MTSQCTYWIFLDVAGDAQSRNFIIKIPAIFQSNTTNNEPCSNEHKTTRILDLTCAAHLRNEAMAVSKAKVPTLGSTHLHRIALQRVAMTVGPARQRLLL